MRRCEDVSKDDESMVAGLYGDWFRTSGWDYSLRFVLTNLDSFPRDQIRSHDINTRSYEIKFVPTKSNSFPRIQIRSHESKIHSPEMKIRSHETKFVPTIFFSVREDYNVHINISFLLINA
jgi:hypothetical protein